MIPKLKNLSAVGTQLAVSTLVAAAAVSILESPAAAFTLTTGVGDGGVTVGVDAFGSFGSDVTGSGTSDAFYNPVGLAPVGGTTFESGVAIRLGPSGTRRFLTSGSIGGPGGGAVTTAISGTSTSATSAFGFSGLNFSLTQTVQTLLSGGVQTGSRLIQSYTITNSTATALDFELIRYFDGDILFNGSRFDGGGRLLTSGQEVLFETDSATGASDSTTFVGIAANGGTTGGFEIDFFDDLRTRIIAGNALDNTITGDSNNDGFVDAGGGYDVTLALARLLSLGAGESTTYTTTTFFGSGAPEDIPTPPDPTPVPTPALLPGLIGMGVAALRRKGQEEPAEQEA